VRSRRSKSQNSCLWSRRASPYTKVALHVADFSSLIVTSMQWELKPFNDTVYCGNQNKARPPLSPILLTAKLPEKPNDHMKFWALVSFIFVSDKKRKEGRNFRTSQRSSPTTESDPKPRQFQHRILIASGGAVSQPPPDPPIYLLTGKRTTPESCTNAPRSYLQRIIKYFGTMLIVPDNEDTNCACDFPFALSPYVTA
jgi:hypothetical protein